MSSNTTILPPGPARTAKDKDIESTESVEFSLENESDAKLVSELANFREYEAERMYGNEERYSKYAIPQGRPIRYPFLHNTETGKVIPNPDSVRRVGLPTDNAARKRLKLWTHLLEYFPDTFLAVVEVSVAGNEQHNPGEELHWDRTKSTDQMNTAFRHQFDYGLGIKKDTDGQWHLAKAIWRLSAQLQLDIEEERNNK